MIGSYISRAERQYDEGIFGKLPEQSFIHMEAQVELKNAVVQLRHDYESSGEPRREVWKQCSQHLISEHFLNISVFSGF